MIPTRATTTAGQRGIHRRASKSSSTQPPGRKSAVGIRKTSSVLPNTAPATRSRKYHPAGKGAPSVLSAAHQFPEFEM